MEVKDALMELARMVKTEIILRLHSPVGVNQRTGRNTLIGSNLEKSIKVNVVGDNELVFQIAEYYQYVVMGRKAGWKNHPPKPPGIIHGITQWVRTKNISFKGMTQNQVIWCVLESLEERDIKARPFIGYDENGDLNKILPFLDEFFDKWADDLFDAIMAKVDAFFKG